MRRDIWRAGSTRAAIAALALVGALAPAALPTGDWAPGTAVAQGPITFRETFDGRPAGPEPWRPTNWDITYHTRDPRDLVAPGPMVAHHAANCAAAPATHEVRDIDNAVYLCNDHMMTTIDNGATEALELEGVLERALRHLRLVRRVRGVELGPAHDVGDDARAVVVVRPGADEARQLPDVLVAARELGHLGDRLDLGERRRHVEVGEADRLRNVGEQLGHRADADRGEHRPPLVGCEGNVRHRGWIPSSV